MIGRKDTHDPTFGKVVDDPASDLPDQRMILPNVVAGSLTVDLILQIRCGFLKK